MKLYRVEYRDFTYEHKGYTFHSSKKDAIRNCVINMGNIEDDIEKIEFETTKEGIIDLLTRYASHPDNG